MSQRVTSWTIELRKAVAYSATLAFREDDVLFDFDSAEIIITPSTGGLLSWTEGNGKFTNVSTGTYQITLTAAETDGYTWTRGMWRLSVVLDGEADPCYIEGAIVVKKC